MIYDDVRIFNAEKNYRINILKAHFQEDHYLKTQISPFFYLCLTISYASNFIKNENFQFHFFYTFTIVIIMMQ